MAQNIAGVGLTLWLNASNTFPIGFPITQFADDADAISSPDITIGETAMGLNGDLLTWAKAVPIPIKIAVVPDSIDDTNLSILFNANRVGANKASAADSISLIVVFPDETTITFNNGLITAGPSISNVLSAGRLKSKEYSFMFEDVSGI